MNRTGSVVLSVRAHRPCIRPRRSPSLTLPGRSCGRGFERHIRRQAHLTWKAPLGPTDRPRVIRWGGEMAAVAYRWVRPSGGARPARRGSRRTQLRVRRGLLVQASRAQHLSLGVSLWTPVGGPSREGSARDALSFGVGSPLRLARATCCQAESPQLADADDQIDPICLVSEGPIFARSLAT